MTTANSLASLGSAGVSVGFKNRIINGAMQVSQYNGTSSISVSTDGVFGVDRFRLGNGGGGTGVFSAQQSSTAPAGFGKSLVLTVTTADVSMASTDLYYMRQWIEQANVSDLNWGSANAKTVTLSFWVYSSVTGTYGACVNNSDYGYSYSFSYTINSANTWEQKTITITGLTVGTVAANNARGFGITWSLGAGSNYTTGTVNSWAAGGNVLFPTGSTNWISTGSATFYITGVQLEVGSSATGFEYRQYGTELALCQRYYSKLTAFSTNGQLGVGISASSSAAWIQVSTPVNLRANPTINYSNITVSDQVSYAPAVTSIAGQGAISSGAGIAFAHAAVATQYRTAIVATSTSAGYIDFSAEL